MQLETFCFNPTAGWSVPAFPALDSADTVLFVFGASSFKDSHAAIDELAKHFPRSVICGCSTAGEIFGTRIQDGGLTVAVARFAKTKVAFASTSVLGSQDSLEAGKKIAATLKRPDLKGIVLLSDGLKVNGSELVRGVNATLGSGVVITGGLAGDGDRFKETWVLADRKPQSGLVTAVGLYGSDVVLGHGSKGGWDIFGPERIVTRSKGNILFQLDGKPALQLYKEYLGDLAKGLPATALLFPLALKSDVAGGKSIVRTIVAVDEAEQSMTFVGDIPQGHRAQLMRANFDRLIEGASDAAQMIGAPSIDGPTLAIAISCVGRRLVLGTRTEEEIEATLEILPKRTQQIGFYSYGEISPYVKGEPCDLHNQTMTLTTIQEAA